MAKRDDRPKPPKFPRRRWSPGQAERTEKPDKGGAYERARRRRRSRDEVDESLDDEGAAPPHPAGA